MKPEELVESVVGKSLADADYLCKSRGYRTRIVCEDGQYYVVTRDYVPTRINLTLTNGVITNASLG
jgi:hypothetical protein